MKKKEFVPLESETDAEFKKRVETFAKSVTTLSMNFMEDVQDNRATSAEVLYF